ncbi:MAG: RNA methyltransferase, partial [Lachnospiraceae bacterium]
GNLGTILRTAEGAGVTGVIMSSDCVDIYNPKTIRSTMGSIFRMPFLYTEEMNELLKKLKNNNIRTFAAHLEGKTFYDQEDYTGKIAFLIGNEGNGLHREIAEQADTWIKIPMHGQVESLNVAIATSILMYEVCRQRR